MIKQFSIENNFRVMDMQSVFKCVQHADCSQHKLLLFLYFLLKDKLHSRSFITPLKTTQPRIHCQPFYLHRTYKTFKPQFLSLKSNFKIEIDHGNRL